MPHRRSSIPVRWQRGAGIDGGQWAMVGARFIGQVVRYDVPEGWAAHLHAAPHGEGRVAGGPWATADEARAALEATWTSRYDRQP